MGDAAEISPHVPSTCVQNAILSLLIIHIIPSRLIYVAIDNSSLVQSVSCLTTSSCIWNYVCVVLATVPFLDRFYYSGSKKTRPRPVRSGFMPNGSLN